MAKRINFPIFLLVFFIFGCKKYVTVDAPTNQLVSSSVFSNDNTAIAAQLSVYANMSYNAVIYSMETSQGLSSDELTTYVSSGSQLDLYANSLNSSDASVGIWSAAYNFIYQENAIIEGLSNATSLSNAVKQQLMGEAKFMRAYWYFNLVNFYGDVPLIITTDYRINTSSSKATKDAIYQQIIADLKEAQNLLNTDYVDASSTKTTIDRARPTKWAAIALLARTYLYIGDNSNAEAQSGTLINNLQMFSLVSDLNNVFKKNSAEAIWQLLPSGPNVNYTWEGYYFILTAPPTAGPGWISLSQQQINSFETGDIRRTNWVGSFTSGTKTYYYPSKYQAGNSSTSQTEYTMMFRLAEQYLIRAEAEANGAGGGLNAAISDLNKIRNRAGLANYSGATDKNSLLAAITHERQVELFTEGHRWFDLKRTGIIDTVMNIVTPLKGGSWKSYQQLYPIPISDISNNRNLSQNPGY